MQVMLEGEWHKRMLDDGSTTLVESPCGRSGDVRFTPKRAESYEGKLCTHGCFLPLELKRAAEIAARKAAEAEQRERESDEQWLERENRRRTSQGMKPLVETPMQRMKRVGAMTDEEFKQMLADEERESAPHIGMPPNAKPEGETK